MAITHTETITLMEVLNANTDNIVSKAVVRTVSTDDADIKNTTQKTEAFSISTSGITTSTAGFVAYEDLTESTVFGWIATPLANSKVKENNEKIIVRMIASENPTSKDKALPW